MKWVRRENQVTKLKVQLFEIASLVKFDENASSLYTICNMLLFVFYDMLDEILIIIGNPASMLEKWFGLPSCNKLHVTHLIEKLWLIFQIYDSRGTRMDSYWQWYNLKHNECWCLTKQYATTRYRFYEQVDSRKSGMIFVASVNLGGRL